MNILLRLISSVSACLIQLKIFKFPVLCLKNIYALQINYINYYK